MKITVNLDAELLDRVVDVTESSTKTDAIMFALREVDRRARLMETLRRGLGAGPEELKSLFDPVSDPLTLRVAETRALYPDSGA